MEVRRLGSWEFREEVRRLAGHSGLPNDEERRDFLVAHERAKKSNERVTGHHKWPAIL